MAIRLELELEEFVQAMSDMQVDSCDNTNNDQEEKEHTASPESYPEIKCRWAQCGEWFLSLHDLAGHVSHAHAVPAGQGLFYCRWDGCSRSHRGFNARYKMLVHVRTHTNEKPHQCNECNKCFSRAENLKIHARSHTGEKPYTCPIPGCDKAYSNSSDRFKHTRTHSIDKPYVCKVAGCDKRYTDPSSLRKHAKTYNHFPTHRTNHDQNSHQERDELEHAGAETRDKTSASRRVQLDYVTTHISTSWLQTLYPQRAWTEEQESPLDLTVHALKHAHPFH